MLHILKRLDKNQIAFFLKSASGRYLSINEAGARMIGKSVENVLGKSDGELFEQASARLMTERDNYILNVIKLSTYDSVANTGGHWLLFHSFKIAPERNEGEPLGLIGISVDITAVRDRDKIALIDEAKSLFIADPLCYWDAIKDYLQCSSDADEQTCENSPLKISKSDLPKFSQQRVE